MWKRRCNCSEIGAFYRVMVKVFTHNVQYYEYHNWMAAHTGQTQIYVTVACQNSRAYRTALFSCYNLRLSV